MKNLLKTIVKNTPLLYVYKFFIHKPLRKYKKFKKKLYHKGKEKVVTQYAAHFNIKTLVETGTYKGQMVKAMKNKFYKIFSIEIGDELYKKAAENFSGDKHVKIIHGDSGSILEELAVKIQEPAVFWLDAHYSGGDTARGPKDTPARDELEIILDRNQDDVILIDDARDFNGTNSYPTVSDIELLVSKKKPNYSVEVKKDIIRISA